jgi:hypothetical protein
MNIELKDEVKFLEENSESYISKYNTAYDTYKNNKRSVTPMLPKEILNMKSLNDSVFEEFVKFEKNINENYLSENFTKDAQNMENKMKKYTDLLNDLDIDTTVSNIKWVHDKTKEYNGIESFLNIEDDNDNKNESIEFLEQENFGIIDTIENNINDYYNNPEFNENSSFSTPKVVSLNIINSATIESIKNLPKKLLNIEAKLKSQYIIEGFGLVDVILAPFKIIINIFKMIWEVIKWWTKLMIEIVKFTVWFTVTVIGNFFKAPIGTCVFAGLTMFLSEAVIKKLTGSQFLVVPQLVITALFTIYILITNVDLLKFIQSFVIELIIGIFVNPITLWLLEIKEDDDFLIKVKKMKESTSAISKAKYLTQSLIALFPHVIKNLFKLILYFVVLALLAKFTLIDIPIMVIEEAVNKFVVNTAGPSPADI